MRANLLTHLGGDVHHLLTYYLLTYSLTSAGLPMPQILITTSSGLAYRSKRLSVKAAEAAVKLALLGVSPP